MSDPVSISLTPAQVRRVMDANARFSSAAAVADQALAAMNQVLAQIVTGAGHKANGANWRIEEDGDSVLLVREKAE